MHYLMSFLKTKILRVAVILIYLLIVVLFLLESRRLPKAYGEQQLQALNVQSDLYGHEYEENLLPNITDVLSHQRVNEDKSFYVLSAYFDHRTTSKMVRITLYRRIDTNIKVFCHFYTSNQSLSTVTVSYDFYGSRQGLSEIITFMNRPVGEWAANCHLPNQENVLKHSFVVVSLHDRPMYLYEQEVIKSAILPIRNMSQELNFEHELGLCIKTMFDTSSANKIGIVEAFELFMKSGITFVRVYMQDMSPHMVKIFNYYHRKWACPQHTFIPSGKKCLTIEVVLLTLPDLTSYAKGQNIAEFDCVYRSVGRVKYLFLHDWDEIIIPHEQEARDLIAVIRDGMLDGKSQLCFVNQWFPMEMNARHAGQYAHYAFRFYGSVMRRDWLDYEAIKCVLRPDHILLQSVHGSLIDVDLNEPEKHIENPRVAIMQHHRMRNVVRGGPYKFDYPEGKASFSKGRNLARYIDEKQWPQHILGILKEIGIFL